MNVFWAKKDNIVGKSFTYDIYWAIRFPDSFAVKLSQKEAAFTSEGWTSAYQNPTDNGTYEKCSTGESLPAVLFP